MRRGCAVLMLAWITWAHSVFLSKGIDEWEPAGATESLEGCKRASVTGAGNSINKIRAQIGRDAIVTQEGSVIEMTLTSGEKASIVFVCLPDTVDPRGPKGK